MFFRKWPAALVRKNLIWARDSGGVWAVWEIRPQTLDWWTESDLVSNAQRWASALGGLDNEWAMWGVCQTITAQALFDRTLGNKTDEHWTEQARKTAAQEAHLWQRRVFIGVRLSGPWQQGPVAYVTSLLSKARRAPDAQQGSLTKRGLTDDPVGGLLTNAERIRYRDAETSLGGLEAQPATPASIVWLSERVGHPEAQPDYETMSIADIELDERRNTLGVLTEAGETQQTMIVIAGLPGTWEYPSSGMWLGKLDHTFAFPIDWIVRAMPSPNRDAIKTVRKSIRNMVGTAHELGHDAAGLPPDLRQAHQSAIAAEEFLQSTNANEQRVVICYRLTASEPDLLEDRAAQLKRALSHVDIRTARPTGGQMALWKSHLPAGHLPKVGYDYHQWVTSHAVVSGQPHNTYSVGDPHGIPIGYSASDMVFVDPAYGPATNRPGAIGLVGEPGSGKSYTSKVLAAGHLWRGGRLVVLDRTELGEWKAFIEAVTDNVAVLRIDETADYDLNPLRMFNSRDDALTHTLAICQILTGVTVRDERSATLIRGIQTIVDKGLALNQLYRGDVLENPKLAKTIGAFALTRLGQMVFNNPRGKPVDTNASAIVWWIPGLAPPPPGLPEGQWLPGHVSSTAAAYLISALNRQSTFGDRKQMGVNMYDEAWALTSSQVGLELLRQEVRDGRKHNAALWMASQHPRDLGASLTGDGAGEGVETLAAMIPTRFLFALKTEEAATLGLAWLGAEQTQARVDEVMNLTTGHCLLRDLSGRICRVYINPPWVDGALAEAIETTPEAT